MKPPPRKRTRKSRELSPVPEPRRRAVCKWSKTEKNKLLAALTKLCPKDLSARETLDPERVREHLPTRSVAEINTVLEGLKEKVILFAITKQREERREDQRGSRSLEMWIQTATAVTGGVEDSLSTAFSQMLTVASIEPRTRPHNAAQPKASKGSSSASSSSSPLPTPSASVTPPARSPPVTEDSKKTSPHTPTTAQRPLVPGTPPQPSVRRKPASSSVTQVSFEKIYHYLSTLHKPSDQCELTPMESAIVLDLLMSLPDELLLLDCDKLSQHLSQVYPSLSPSAPSSQTPDSSKGDSSTQRSAHPPLNPFLIPVSLLARKARTEPT